MSQFKGTQGKWYVSKAYKTINDEKGFGIAQENGIRNSNEWDANALLISKAPEMLEMLKKLVERLEENDLGRLNAVSQAKQLINEATQL
jgi:hypothetical protein